MRLIFLVVFLLSPAYSVACADELSMIEIPKQIRLNRDGVEHFDPMLKDGSRGRWDGERHAFWATTQSRLRNKQVRLDLADERIIRGKVDKVLVSMTSWNELGAEMIEELYVRVTGELVPICVKAEEIVKFHYRPNR